MGPELQDNPPESPRQDEATVAAARSLMLGVEPALDGNTTEPVGPVHRAQRHLRAARLQ